MLPSPYKFEKEDKKKISRGDKDGHLRDEDSVRCTLNETLPYRHKPTSQISVKSSHQSHKADPTSQISVKTSYQSQKPEPTSQILVQTSSQKSGPSSQILVKTSNQSQKPVSEELFKCSSQSHKRELRTKETCFNRNSLSAGGDGEASSLQSG